MLKRIIFAALLALGTGAACAQEYTGESLSRGFVGRPSGERMYLSWRMFADDDANAAFDLYRSTNGGKAVKINAEPIVRTSDFMDGTVDFAADNRWELRQGGRTVAFWERKGGEPKLPYLRVPIQRPKPGEVFGQKFTYSANDCSVGDLDGDGEYEIVLKWEVSNSKRPPQTGFAGNTLVDAYKLDGTRLWRIDLGRNIRSGAATTQLLVFDFDGDGRAELCCKTGDGTVDGVGEVIGDAQADWRTAEQGRFYGKIVNGPEYVTVFRGSDGKALATEEYVPTRYPLDGWGGIGGNGGNDNTGGRSDRFSAGVALLDGKTPSPFFVRGWYGRTVVAAWTFDGEKLALKWAFDSALPEWEGYSGMGNHSVTVADFDGDGCDEICVGAMTVDHDGKGLFTTGLRHGDALHAGDLIPSRPGLEVFGVHENEEATVALGTPAVALFDGRTGEIVWSDGPGEDAGRGVAADIDPRYEGAECWGGPGGLRRGDTGEFISDKVPNSCNFIIYWDADPQSELLDRTAVSKWNPETETTEVVMQAEGAVSNNGTKSNPCLSGDLLGDWREEVIWASEDQSELRIYLTDIPAVNRMPTLMQDRQYRLAVAWQNVAYNQPPHPSFDMAARFREIEAARAAAGKAANAGNKAAKAGSKGRKR